VPRHQRGSRLRPILSPRREQQPLIGNPLGSGPLFDLDRLSGDRRIRVKGCDLCS
jgi:hypothetical protein